jgi:hypothetical protein
MKIIIEFNLPEEREEYQNSINGTDWRGVVQALDEMLRQKLKYGEISGKTHKEVEEIRTSLHEFCSERNLSVHD